ncbi:MAG: ABC transporter ATP-binding protein [Acidaminococcus sp.]|jgi:osmoprotectant transport system ATP-binding protein|nr:ABC transporter ATP-binding protein [Acidaminococcus sp.]MCI2099766.1 ABC transporter ATP-binding protein [Acidaminococcus sp.]MCI2113964.1 ABC transporter ATP-binding protein [Acidaminococcus sp.]MCI2117079.1 ABC transporter ATP-binding protein [Acidaminococcus sp.]
MSEKIIEFKHVKKAYGNNIVIKDLSFSVEKGDFVTMIGSSGGGKTTTLKMVNALIEPTAGDIFVEGTNIKDRDPVQLRRSIGYAIQGSVLFPNMTVEENIAYVPNLLNKQDKQRTAQAVDKWMKIVGLDPSMKDRYPDELSGGQQQRVGIARALAASPHILLMDEPFGAVDEITRSSLQDEIMRIHRETKITILFVTHDIQEALKLADKVFIMDHGEIQQYDTPNQILQHPANEFVEKLLWRERHACLLGEDRVNLCEFSRAAHGMENAGSDRVSKK